MRRIYLIILLSFFYCLSFSQTRVRGRVLGEGNRLLKDVHVVFCKNGDIFNTKDVKTSADGTFALTMYENDYSIFFAYKDYGVKKIVRYGSKAEYNIGDIKLDKQAFSLDMKGESNCYRFTMSDYWSELYNLRYTIKGYHYENAGEFESSFVECFPVEETGDQTFSVKVNISSPFGVLIKSLTKTVTIPKSTKVVVSAMLADEHYLYDIADLGTYDDFRVRFKVSAEPFEKLSYVDFEHKNTKNTYTGRVYNPYDSHSDAFDKRSTHYAGINVFECNPRPTHLAIGKNTINITAYNHDRTLKTVKALNFHVVNSSKTCNNSNFNECYEYQRMFDLYYFAGKWTLNQKPNIRSNCTSNPLDRYGRRFVIASKSIELTPGFELTASRCNFFTIFKIIKCNDKEYFKRKPDMILKSEGQGALSYDWIDEEKLYQSDNNGYLYEDCDNSIQVTPTNVVKWFYVISNENPITGFEIYNVNGVLIHSQKISSEMTYDFDLSFLSNGLYLIKIKAGQTTKVVKIRKK